MEHSFKLGESIVHKAEPSIKWVIESIDGDLILCSTLNSETCKQVHETFSINVITYWEEPIVYPVVGGGRDYSKYSY